MPEINMVVLDETDVTSVGPEHIRLCYKWELPFRFRIGDLYRYRHSRIIDLWFKNKVSIPFGTDVRDVPALLDSHADSEDLSEISSLHTDALVIIRDLKWTDDRLESIRSGAAGRTPPDRGSMAVSALNHFATAYHMVAGPRLGAGNLTKLRPSDFWSYCERLTHIVCRPDRELSEHDVLGLLAKKKPVLRQGESFGDCADLSTDTIGRLDLALKLQGSYIFYDFIFEADIKHIDGDVVFALLAAVVALEGAHAAYLRLAITDRFTGIEDETERTKKVDENLERLLKDAGLSTLVPLTPYLFMAPEERPSAKDLDECAKGITIRNEIMHCLKKRGQYKLRNRTEYDIQTGYYAVRKVCASYVAAIHGRVRLRDSEFTQ